ncbi:MAG: hypothetical protein KC766_02435 [Myxococcales bacterium]|nr:hypothetical protein [Myxococcales bacterium]
MADIESVRSDDLEATEKEVRLCNQQIPEFPVDIGTADSFEIVANELLVPYSTNLMQEEAVTVKPLLVRNGEVERAPEAPIATGASDVHYQLPEPDGDGEEIIAALEFHVGNQWAWSDKVELVAKGGTWQPAERPVVFAELGEVPPSPGEPPLTGEEIPPSESSVDLLERLGKLGFPTENIVLPSQALVTGGASIESSTTRVCLKQLVTQVGEGIGEDIFTSDTYYNSRYLLAYIPGAYFNFLDASGCAYVNISGWTTITVYSIGSYDYRDISVGTTAPPMAWTTRSFTVNIAAGVTNTFNWAPPSGSQQFNITLFGIMALMRWPGPWQGTYNFYSFVGSSGYNDPSHDIYVGSGNDKTLVNHELGHCFFYRNTYNPWQKYNYIDQGVTAPCQSGSSNHDIDTIELASSSANEGFATFYAATSFNYLDQAPNANCRLYHFKYPNFDCLGSASEPIPYMETTCNFDNPWNGQSVEADWIRALWYIRTAGGVSNDDITTWLSYHPLFTPSFTDTNIYSNLDFFATWVFLGDPTKLLDTHWDYAKWFYGIDH